MIRLSIQMKKVLTAWRSHLGEFTERERSAVLVWSGLGAIAGGVLRLALSDHAFQKFLSSKYIPAVQIFDNSTRYFPYLIIFAMTVFLAIAFRVPGFVRRGLRSWLTGTTSGLVLLSFTSTFVLLILHSPPRLYQLVAIPAILFILFAFSFVLHLMAKSRIQNTPSEDDLRVSMQARSLVGTQLSESDDPIRTWGEDALGRVSLVESMSVKLMISKSPVLALFGEFGSGKTSILNLLRSHLEDKAIVVSFSTWLPGSQETLIAYLLSDIANECQRQYVVPGLRKSAQRLARVLAQNVPVLKSYLELLPAATQKEDIASMNAALARLPKRVIVLLDELDRMEKDELVTLLKVIRGTSSLPNLSFVCAGERKTMVEMVRDGFNDKSNTYFEKFFPASIPIPKIPPTVLRKVGTQRLVATFIRRNWLENESEVEGFRKQIDAMWSELIAPFCRTLRAIGSLANDVEAAAVRLKHEVHPVDMTLIELLRRFKPDIYEIVGRNPVALTGGESILRGGSMLLEKEKANLDKQLLADLTQATAGDEELGQVSGILGELFPHFRKIDSRSWPRLVGQESHDKGAPRISQPRIFSAYFDYELPENVFSYVELHAVLQRMTAATNGSNIAHAFLETLDSMEKGSLKRDDFLAQLGEAAQKSMPLPTGKALVHAAMKAAHKYTYDMLAAFGEAGHVLRIVLRVAQRLPASERLTLLENCILEATDDTMALNILTRLTGKQNDFDLDVSLAQLRPTFVSRMRKRYGRDVDAVNIDLSTSDPWAFNYWGFDPKNEEITIDPEDRAIQHDFWLRHIGNSRSRLGQAFRGFFMPASVRYSEDPTPFVENKIPLSDLKRLYEELPDDGQLNDLDRQSLRVLSRLINGEFKNGVPFDGPYTAGSDEDTSSQS